VARKQETRPVAGYAGLPYAGDLRAAALAAVPG
jgi:hypothetical protein